MYTTVTIKTEKKLHREAKKTAAELGVPLTTIMNSMLKQFVREQAVVLTTYPTPKASKLREWAKMSENMDKHPEKYPSYTVDELFSRWDTLRASKKTNKRKKALVHA